MDVVILTVLQKESDLFVDLLVVFATEDKNVISLELDLNWLVDPLFLRKSVLVATEDLSNVVLQDKSASNNNNNTHLKKTTKTHKQTKILLFKILLFF